MLRYEERVYRLAYRILLRAEDARDTAQEVFLSIWENPQAYRPTAEFSTWLYRITLNRAIGRWRRRRVGEFLSLSRGGDEIEVESDPDGQPDREAERTELLQSLETEIQHLPVHQRATLHLRYKEDLPVKAIAETLRISEKSAESLLFRAKQTLRARLKDLK
ncbi:MAG: sigma-70 family RNA polymerase sigma factor [Calditrichaeota bacterium]|nr:sigma-70 family RNA polymerase sigma factor [Calditrichota bacterium]